MGRKQKSKRSNRPRAKGESPLSPQQAPSRSSRLASRLLARWDLIAAPITALVLVGFQLFQGEYFLGSGTDIVSLQHPLHVFATAWMKQGILPLWNPFIWGGSPFQAGVHGYLYPGWWSGMFLPSGLDIKVGILLHAAIAAAGGTWFARARVTHRPASYLSGIVYGLSAFFIVHLYAGHRVMAATACYLPWIAGVLLRGAFDKRRFLMGVATSGLMMLAGHYQIIFIGMGGLLLFVLLEGAVAGKWRRDSKGALFEIGRPFTRWLLLLGGGALIASVQLIPMAAAIGLSQRPGGDPTFAASHASAPINLLTYLLPNLFGNREEVPFVGNWDFWESLGYIGVIPFALVLLSPIALPWKRVLPALLVMLAATLVALGDHTPVFGIYLASVPGADLFRAPGRFALLPTLLGALLAAEMLDAWMSNAISRRRRRIVLVAVWVIAMGIPLALLGVFSLDLSGFAPWLMTAAGGETVHQLSAGEWDALTTVASEDILKAVLLLVGFAVLWSLSHRFPSQAKTVAALLVLVVVLDLAHFGGRFLKTGPARYFHLPDDLTVFLEENASPGLRIIPPASSLWQDFPAMHAIGNPGGYDIFLDRRYARYLNRASGNPLDTFISIDRIRRGSRLIRHLGPEYLLTHRPLRNGQNPFVSGFDWVTAYQRVGNVFVYKNKEEPKRVALAHRLEIVEDELETYRRMEQESFDLAGTVLVEEKPPAGFTLPALPPEGTEEKAVITLLEPNRVEISVTAAGDAVLVLSDTLQPGWSAAVDGHPVPMVHANRVMRALPVPEGAHRVTMTYRPASFIAGLMVSLVTILFGLAWARQPFFQRRG